MNLHNSTADIFVPDSVALSEALSRTTHLGIGAHQDDLEFMAFHGIEACFGQKDKGFTGVTCTNGSGSPRAGIYAPFTDPEMQAVRRLEQRKAASIGQYAAMLQLDYPSAILKDPSNRWLSSDLVQILSAAHPEVVYTHNPADKHDTHLAVVVAVVQAVRELPMAIRPTRLYGCEIWRDLDWLPDADKVILDVSHRQNLAAALSGIFDSQISGGKRYDLAVMGRRRANATFLESHGVDQAELLTFGMDLTPLLENDALDLVDYVVSFIEKFKAEVANKLKARVGR